MKTRPKSKQISRSKKAANGPSLNMRGSANSQGTSSKRVRGITKTEDSSIESGPSLRNSRSSPPIPNLPHSENVILRLKSMNCAKTFLDSVLNLCIKSVTSCDDSGCLEFMFLQWVREFGLIRAKQWAELLHMPHKRSYSLLSSVLFGLHGSGPSP